MLNDTVAGVRKRLMKGFVAQGFSQLVTLIIQVCSVPLFIHYWGKVLYGEWLLLSTVPAYFALSDLGFASAAATEMTLRVASGDKKKALEVFQSAWVLITGLSLAVTLIMLVGVHFLPIRTWLKLTTLSQGVVATLVTILVIQVCFSLQRGLLSAGYRCDGNYAAGVVAGNLQQLVEFVAGMAALVAGSHLLGLALVVLMTRVTTTVLIRLDVRRRSPWLMFGWRHATVETLKGIASPAIAFMGFPLGNALSLQGMLTLVGATLGPTMVVVFSTSRTLTRFVWQMLNAITNTIWVELSTAFGAGNLVLARALHRRACQAAFWIAFPSCTALYLLGPLLFHLWTKGKVPFDAGLFAILLTVVICNSLWSASYSVPLAVNRHQKLALVYMAATALSLGLGYIFVRVLRLGVHGAAMALLVIDVFMIAYVVRRSLTLVQDNFADYARAVLTPPIGLLRRVLPRLRRVPVKAS